MVQWSQWLPVVAAAPEARGRDAVKNGHHREGAPDGPHRLVHDQHDCDPADGVGEKVMSRVQGRPNDPDDVDYSDLEAEPRLGDLSQPITAGSRGIGAAGGATRTRMTNGQAVCSEGNAPNIILDAAGWDASAGRWVAGSWWARTSVQAIKESDVVALVDPLKACFVRAVVDEVSIVVVHGRVDEPWLLAARAEAGQGSAASRAGPPPS